MHENEIATKVIGAAIEAHKALGGPGLLESVYQEALAVELRAAGLVIHEQLKVTIPYKDMILKHSLQLDLMVAGRVIVEVKATERYNDVFEAQLLTYLRITGCKLGLVINFGEGRLKNGIHRVVNGL